MAKAIRDENENEHVRVITFARTFSEKAHAQSFLKGHVRMQTVEHFRKLEDSSKALRGDAYEGISAIWQPSQLSGIMVGPHKILPSHLTGPVQLHDVQTSSWHVFCMHTIGITPDDPIDFETPEDYKRSLLLDERCADFGDHLVFMTDADRFLKRLLEAVQARRFNYRATLVRYFNELEFSGFFPKEDVPFRKPKRFAYQKEYRVVVKTPPGVPSPLVIEMGDISDVAHLTTFGEFNSSLQIGLPDGTKV